MAEVCAVVWSAAPLKDMTPLALSGPEKVTSNGAVQVPPAAGAQVCFSVTSRFGPTRLEANEGRFAGKTRLMVTSVAPPVPAVTVTSHEIDPVCSARLRA